MRDAPEMLWAAALHVGGADQAERLRALARQDLDWTGLVEAATRLGAMNLLSAALARAEVAAPPGADEAFRRERLRAGVKSLVAESFLGDLLQAFGARGIPCMVLKGLPLAAELYGDPLVRSSDDVDLIVPPRHRDAALEIVHGLDFALPRGSFSLEFYRRHHFHVGLVRERQREVALELHWDFQPRFSLTRVAEAEAWRHPRTIRVGSLEVPVLDREVSFLYLIQHLARHLVVLDAATLEDPVGALLEPGRHGRLTWFTDLMLMSSGVQPLDWDRMERLAREWGLEGELAWVTALLRTARLEAPTAAGSPMAGSSMSGSTSPAPIPEKPPSAFSRLSRAMPGIARPSRRLQFRPMMMLRLGALAFPGGDWIRNRYGLTGASRLTVAARSVGHAGGVVLDAIRLAGATVGESLRSESRASVTGLAVLLMALAAAVRFPGLGRASLWWDECDSVETALSVARAPIGTVARALAGGLSPYFVMLAPWVHPDTSELLLRLPSVLAGIALVLAAAWLGQEIGGRSLAWRLGIAAAVAPFFVWHAREARFYPFAWALAGSAAVYFFRALKAMKTRDLLLCLALNFLAAAVYMPSLSLLVVEAGCLLAARSRRLPEKSREGAQRSLPTWVAGGAGLLLIGALGIWLARALVLPVLHSGSAGLGFTHLGGVRPLAVLDTPIAFVTGYSIGPGPMEWHRSAPLHLRPSEAAVLLCSALGFFLLAAGGIRHLIRSGQAAVAVALVTLGILPPVAILLACAWSRHVYAPRHAGLACLFWLALASAGTLSDERWGRTARGGALLLLAIQALSVWNLHTSPRYLREEVGPAARYVASVADTDDLVLVFGGIDLPWNHYYRGAAPSRVVYADDPAAWSPASIQALAAGRHRIIEVTGGILGSDAEAPLHAALREVSSEAGRRSFHAVEVVQRQVDPARGP
jgi:4-amino-4-deoxy-L-arabinose transferase-like glycosyltransferase